MKERLMILGAGIMQGPAIRTARGMNLETVVVDGNKDAPCAGEADIFEQIDLKDKDRIAELALKLKKEGLSGIMTAGTDFSATVAWAAEKAGLPGIPYEAALNASDKGRMRRCFKKAGIPSPDFLVIDQIERTKAPELPFSYPVVIKPVDNMGGRGCKRANNETELRVAVSEALKFSRSGRAIVEEYMDGPEYSVDAIVYDGKITICGLADRHIYFPPYFIEMGHTMPAELNGETADILLETFKNGVRSLGLTLGAAKGDIKLTSKGPMIGEIAARLSGGYMSGWTYPYSSGADPAKAAILAALGRLDPQNPQGLQRKWNMVSAERAFISIPGTVRAIKIMKSAENNKYVKNIFFRAREGERVYFPENNVSKCGNVISAAPCREEAVKAAEDFVRGILIRLTPRDAGTDNFLYTDTAPENSPETRWPPGAFDTTMSGTFGNEIRGALKKLPSRKPNPQKAGIVPFPEMLESGAVDYVGRGVTESLDAVRTLTGLELPLDREGTLGREFWAALIRGGYQGAAYLLDNLE
ncbi:MAG: ATP-grasp domain-containing protein [Spirochaetaceae bacterium]|jgi:biotin carboxylase|nr:ATP-grasp domain-containing protein [Spirochaetaceae bacterium]